MRSTASRHSSRWEGSASRRLDRGLNTSGSAWEPEHDHPDRTNYLPSPWHVLPRALRYVGVSDRDVFVEFGCGKGRVVHQAARRPFRRVVGVEISPVLAAFCPFPVPGGVIAGLLAHAGALWPVYALAAFLGQLDHFERCERLRGIAGG